MSDSKKLKQSRSTSAGGRAKPAVSGGSTQQNRPVRRRSAAVWVTLGALAVLAFAVWIVFGRQHGAAISQSSATPAPFTGVAVPSQGHQGHGVGDLKRYAHFHYSTDPPTSGFHREIFTNNFVETKPIPKYVQVHLLEHGNVLVQYSCMCPETIKTLVRIAGEFDSRLISPGSTTASLSDVRNAEEQGLAVIVAPYYSMQKPVAVTAWARLGTLADADEAKIVSFINSYLHNADNLNR
ncbi:MAG: DUF3105 domain-containing protein [Candidatus Eremiobacteraeota bacterium]|nr:DUF3105 domain-containing protein [Candidatus Eremiobacteraeota bacterium]